MESERHIGVQLVRLQQRGKILSSYAESLKCETLTRYKEKVEAISSLDPFGVDLGAATESVPPLEASDLVAYLVLQTNFITTKQFKAHKSLEAYNQFVCGWIKDVRTWRIAGKYVTTARVSLSAGINSCIHLDTGSV